MKIVIILPTYNEKENITLMLGALQEQFRNIPHSMNILVVDDNSPDGTADLVRKNCKSASNLFLITGEKEGLGAAYSRGITFALSTLRADAVMEMDADFSHNPADVPRLIEAFDQGADFVIGSRYVTGGTVPEKWGLHRRMISTWGNVFARYVAGMYGVRDCTAGFRVIRASLLETIESGAVNVKGYAFLTVQLYEAISKHGKVKEIPVSYVDRKRGSTKLGLTDIIEFMLQACRIRVDRSRRFWKRRTCPA